MTNAWMSVYPKTAIGPVYVSCALLLCHIAIVRQQTFDNNSWYSFNTKVVKVYAVEGTKVAIWWTGAELLTL